MYAKTKNIEEELKILRDYAEELSKDSRRSAEFLCKLGINTRSGRLRKWYK